MGWAAAAKRIPKKRESELEEGPSVLVRYTLQCMVCRRSRTKHGGLHDQQNQKLYWDKKQHRRVVVNMIHRNSSGAVDVPVGSYSTPLRRERIFLFLTDDRRTSENSHLLFLQSR